MNKIAIVGLSCLFPGASNVREYWDNLIQGKDSRSTATEVQMGVDPSKYFSDKKGVADTFYCVRGGYISGFEPDLDGLELPVEELSNLDRVFTWPLHVARKALEDSGQLGSEALKRTGVVLGNLSFPTKTSNGMFIPMYEHAVRSGLKKAGGPEGLLSAPWMGAGKNSWDNARISGHPAQVISKALGLRGPHLALDAACASSLYSVRLACDYLNSGRADMMLAGAVSAADPFFVNMGFSIFQAYPEGKESSPLDQSSGGLVAGEGAGMFLLKRLEDAQADGDHVYAVIRGAGLSNDGRGASVLSPNPKGQILAFERAYEDAQVAPSRVGFVECHATGTPLGDNIELDSMDCFFRKHGAAPLIGSVKSSLGHLLTAAGMAGMTKLILSMAEGKIPGTLGIENPLDSKQGLFAERIPANPVPWPQEKSQPLGAVSAFGFGGANAHMIFEKGEGAQEGVPKSKQAPATFPELAIVGMDAHFGACSSLDEYLQSIYEGNQQFIPLPKERWKGLDKQEDLLKEFGFAKGQAPRGAYIKEFDLDFLRFKIPPNPHDQLINQQMLAMKVADNAISRAALSEGDNLAVIVAMGTEPELHRFRGRVNLTTRLPESLKAAGVHLSEAQEGELRDICKDSIHNAAKVNQYTSFIGNIMAARISSLWDFSGPSFTVSCEEDSVFRAMEAAAMLLEKQEVDAVVVGAVDLSGSAENVLWRNSRFPVQSGRATLSFDKDITGWNVGEGAGAIVLKRADKARAANQPIQCLIRSLAFASGQDKASVERAANSALNEVGLAPSQVGYVEAWASGIPAQDEAEAQGLQNVFSKAGAEPVCALGSAKSIIGHCFAASQMASIIKTALCVHHGFLPRTPEWSSPKDEASWNKGAFFVPEQSQPWLSSSEQPERVASVCSMSLDGGAAHMILSQNAGCKPSSTWTMSGPYFIPISGNSLQDLEAGMESLTQALESGKNPETCSSQFYLNLKPEKFSLALVGSTSQELMAEISAAREGIAKALETGEDWYSLRGSAFSPKPLGKKGKVAFVYPGGFSSYPQMGRDFFQLFPHSRETVLQPNQRLGDLLWEKKLYPRGMASMAPAQQVQNLEQNPITMFESGIMFAISRTDAIRECFGIQPNIAMGYSMGEISMMYSLGVWDRTDAMSKILRKSPVFRTRLAGPMETVRKAWGLPKQKDPGQRIWHSFALKTSPRDVREILEREMPNGNRPKAFHIFTNTPNEVVIAGDEKSCKKVIRKAGCEYYEVAMGDAIHCDIVRADFNEMAKLHRLDVNPITDVRFLTSVGCKDLTLDRDHIAQNIADMYCSPVDFAALANKAYEDGARIFIELGPRENCTNYINEILVGKEHVAVATDRKGAGCKISILRALARLFAHQAPMDLSHIIPVAESSEGKKQLVKTITLGGPDIEATIQEKAAPMFRKGASEPKPRPASTAQEKVVKLPLARPIPVQQPEAPSMAVPAPNPMPSGDISMQEANNPIHKPGILQNMFDENQRLAGQGHEAFLRNRANALDEMEKLLQIQTRLMQQAAGAGVANVEPLPAVSPAPVQPVAPSAPIQVAPIQPAPMPAKPAIWDRQDLERFAHGDIAGVFGEKYSIIDSYSRRVRLPMDPYLLVSRVTKLDAECGEFKPSTMTTEFDIEKDAWFLIDGQIPWAVSVESGQCDLLLISYLGIDFECKGHRVYRLLDCTLTFMEDLAKEGQTLRYDISINSFARNGGNLLFFFSYECFVDDKLVLTMDGGCAGFFSDEELAAGKGIIRTQGEIEERKQIERKHFTPLLECPKRSFNKEDLLSIIDGKPSACFGGNYDQSGLNPSLKFAAQQMLMVDRVESVDPTGGPWGLGEVIAHKDLRPDHWYFPCHFKDDEVMAGSLMAEGCVQLLQFFTMFMGLQTKTRDARFQPIKGLPQKVRCRGQVVPTDTLLTYRMEVKEIGLEPEPYAVADVDILLGDKVVVDFKDLGVRLSEKNPGSAREITPLPKPVKPEPKPVFNKQDLVEFATGDISKCFGPAFSIYEDRQPPRTPNGDLQLISRVLEVTGQPGDFKNRANVVSEYDVPGDVWFCRENAWPYIMPYSMFMEIALQPCGFISTYVQTTLMMPEKDLFFRNLDGQGTLHFRPDLRGKTITNRSVLLSTAKAGGAIIQKFTFELEVDGRVFYEGTAAFGYFAAEALEDQIGLDGGVNNHPLHTKEHTDGKTGVVVDLTKGIPEPYACTDSQPHYGLSGEQLQFLDRVIIKEQGGKFGKGYLYADKLVNPSDWFYPCHFHNDPVMPGSLGVESMLQAIQVFCIHQGLGKEFKSPHFTQMVDTIVWKYRGQIIPTNERMTLELHIKSVEQEDGEIKVKADASLWKNNIRIYEVTDVGLSICEAASDKV